VGCGPSPWNGVVQQAVAPHCAGGDECGYQDGCGTAAEAADRAAERIRDWLDDAGDDLAHTKGDVERGHCNMAWDGIVLFSRTASDRRPRARPA
jgi:hypothetical protein